MSSLSFHKEVGCGGEFGPYIMIYSSRFNGHDIFPFLLRLSKKLTFYFYGGAVWVRGQCSTLTFDPIYNGLIHLWFKRPEKWFTINLKRRGGQFSKLNFDPIYYDLFHFS